MNIEQHPGTRIQKPMFKPVLLSIVILVSGIVIGSGLTWLALPRPAMPELPPAPEFIRSRMVERMAEELHLSVEQQEQIKPIIAKHMNAIDALRAEAQPKIRQEIEAMNEEILQTLDETQKQRWQEQIKRMQEGFRRMHRRGPGEERRDRDEGRMGPGDDRRDRDDQRMGPFDRQRPEMPGRPRRRMPDPADGNFLPDVQPPQLQPSTPPQP
ncbi:MAG: hypothetical protein KBI46_05535 [Phycisphaerae bacterium]|nr:hypothetical protein [Phycisphaerae bacterium]